MPAAHGQDQVQGLVARTRWQASLRRYESKYFVPASRRNGSSVRSGVCLAESTLSSNPSQRQIAGNTTAVRRVSAPLIPRVSQRPPCPASRTVRAVPSARGYLDSPPSFRCRLPQCTGNRARRCLERCRAVGRKRMCGRSSTVPRLPACGRCFAFGWGIVGSACQACTTRVDKRLLSQGSL